MIYGVIPADQTEANARLIAAAPDLLEALCAIVSAGDSIPVDDSPERYATVVLGPIEQARVAIAKATGGSRTMSAPPASAKSLLQSSLEVAQEESDRRFLHIPDPNDSRAAPQIHWEPLDGVKEWRGYLPNSPETTLFLMGSWSQGVECGFTLRGAFVPDEAERDTDWPTFEAAQEAAQSYMDEWIERHTNGWKEPAQ